MSKGKQERKKNRKREEVYERNVRRNDENAIRVCCVQNVL
jgi:hypothetical protein